ncbi:MAG: LLM class flavin-dependent oxidoreductase [Anaerolineae bacterium]|nr:LLM class flavin-dependent oxidoreductase [Anaerolineae bacterium]
MPCEISIAFQTDKTPAQYIALARQVNQYAFDGVSVYCDAPFHPSYGPLLLMAPHLERARLGPAAVSPSRMAPIDIAANTALLAGLAPGGVYVGLARGAWLAEHGIREIKPPIQAIRETVAIVRGLLAGESGGFSGDIYQIAKHIRAPYPLPETPIRVMIGTWGPKLAAAAGEIADEVKIGGSANPALVPVMQGYVAPGQQAAGRPPESVGIVLGAVTVVDADRRRAREAARQAAALYLPVVMPLDPTITQDPALLARIRQHVNAGEVAAAGRLISDDLLDRFAFAGDAQDIIRQAEALFQAGARRIEFGTPHGLPPQAGIDILGKEVLPVLKKHWR